MKQVFVFLLTMIFLGSTTAMSYASDWDKAGKALTIIEGLRLVTGGRVDVVGNIGEVATGRTYTNRDTYNRSQFDYYHPRPYRPRQQIVKHYYCEQERVWVPEFRWIKKHVPEHEEIHPQYGSIIIEEHYIRVKQEHGGRWVYQDNCR
ncbi:MAG: hypothetical protein K8I00_10425 [Candidatus Omnitrophica bacterium]|nr:hypothetical protein [Candidatus Omnitrophota bacterium]